MEDSEVVPWMVPLLCDSNNASVAAALRRAGFESGVYHFDFNRNMLKPRFVECVALPCHQRLHQKDIAKLIAVVRKALKK